MELATLSGGCFWCTEAIFKRLKGVNSVVPGYAGGNPPTGGAKPTYQNVHYNNDGYAESIQIEFYADIIPYEKILEVFWHMHNPTTLNRQEADVGKEYRSAIFYHNAKQKQIAEKTKKEIQDSRIYKDPIVTEITPFTTFYPAEEEHKDYFDSNRSVPYCRFVIDPKISKLLKEFGNDVKEEYKTNS